MKAVERICAGLAMAMVLSQASFGGDTAAPKSPAKKRTATTEKAAPPARTAKAASARPALAPARPAQGALDNGNSNRMIPMPATTGTLGFFTVETAETLPRKGFSSSIFVNKFSRMPGGVTVLNVGWNVGVGVSDWFNVYMGWDPHRHLHVGSRTQLSFNTGLSNPGFAGTIYRSLAPVVGIAPGYVEDYPFAGHNGGGRGEVALGFKMRVWSERKGNPFTLSVRNEFFIPTHSGLVDLLDTQGQTGEFNYGVGVAVSKTWGDVVTGAFNWGYRFTRDPRSGDTRLMSQADQMRFSAGLLVFPESRIQLMTEANSLVFVGDHTANTSFGPRAPVDGIWGLRLYPWRNFGVDVGYRYMINLTQHTDRNGFVIKAGWVHWPEKPKPVNRYPAASCSAEKSSVYAESGESVNVAVQASDPDGDALTYAWTATGGAVEGSGPNVRWNSRGTKPGTYTVTARVDDGHGGSANCAVDIRVEPRPNRAPTMTCSAERSTVQPGERVRITATARDADNDALSYSWRTNGGRIMGSGNSVQLDTSGLAPGSYTVTGRVDDARGAAADCSVGVSVQAPPPPPEASKLNECFFRGSSARVDNVCKRVLDDVALRLQNDPRGRVILIGYADPKEPRPDRLAGQRAANAKKYLASKGIAESRVDTRTAGGQAGAGKQNRRLDVIWLPEGATY